ncbi:MAG: hypothetical protein WCA82_12245, partial [Jiangellales bacterium]
SEWQEYVKHGSTMTYPEWARHVLEHMPGNPSDWFWDVHDPVSIVSRWSGPVPRNHIHLVATPPSGAPSDMLWRRFASVIGIDPAATRNLEAPANQSLGIGAAEVLRRVNELLPPQMPWWHRTGVVRDLLANEVMNPLGTPGRPSLPADLAASAAAQESRMLDDLPSLGVNIIGDLPRAPMSSSGDPEPSEAELAALAIEALAVLLGRVGDMRDDRRAAEQRLVKEHHAELVRLQVGFEEGFWEAHPLVRRWEDTKKAVVESERSSVVIAAALAAYRWARGRTEQDG